jgi:hypothetical protein
MVATSTNGNRNEELLAALIEALRKTGGMSRTANTRKELFTQTIEQVNLVEEKFKLAVEILLVADIASITTDMLIESNRLCSVTRCLAIATIVVAVGTAVLAIGTLWSAYSTSGLVKLESIQHPSQAEMNALVGRVLRSGRDRNSNSPELAQ